MRERTQEKITTFSANFDIKKPKQPIRPRKAGTLSIHLVWVLQLERKSGALILSKGLDPPETGPGSLSQGRPYLAAANLSSVASAAKVKVLR